MTRLNHLNLSVSNVPELTRFFESCFGFRLMHQRGAGKFNLLMGEDGFVLALMHDKAVGENPYPGMFHVGFHMDATEKVRQCHRRMVEEGFDAPEPALLQQGRKAYGFYCNAPGGVMVEVSTPAE